MSGQQQRGSSLKSVLSTITLSKYYNTSHTADTRRSPTADKLNLHFTCQLYICHMRAFNVYTYILYSNTLHVYLCRIYKCSDVWVGGRQNRINYRHYYARLCSNRNSIALIHKLRISNYILWLINFNNFTINIGIDMEKDVLLVK